MTDLADGPRPDVCVVGAGVMGCAVAWRLAQAGCTVTVLERSVPGAEASGSAAGMLAAQGEVEAAGPFLDLCLAGRARWPEFAAELSQCSGVDVRFRQDGIVYPALSAARMEDLSHRAAWQRGLGLHVEVLDTAGAIALEPALTPDVAGALYVPGDGQVSCPDLTRALHGAAEVAGARFRPGVDARALLETGGRAQGVLTGDGERLHAGAVVVAGGAWTGLLEGVALPAGFVRPARGQMLALRTPRPPLRRPAVAGGVGYAVPTSDGRTLVGSTMELVGFERAVTVAGLAHMAGVARQLVPSLSEAAVVDAWCGFRPWTADGRPLVGPTSTAGLHLAAGHFRNGILLCPITADAVSACVLGAAPAVDLDLWGPARLTRTGG